MLRFFMLVSSFLLLIPVSNAQSKKQKILGPGLYVYQTRITSETCGESKATGRVTSYYAAIHGIPFSTKMEMELLNSANWPKWDLVIEGKKIKGNAKRHGNPDSEVFSKFEMTPDDDQFEGKGRRTYKATIKGKRRVCSVHVDTLLKRIDR